MTAPSPDHINMEAISLEEPCISELETQNAQDSVSIADTTRSAASVVTQNIADKMEIGFEIFKRGFSDLARAVNINTPPEDLRTQLLGVIDIETLNRLEDSLRNGEDLRSLCDRLELLVERQLQNMYERSFISTDFSQFLSEFGHKQSSVNVQSSFLALGDIHHRTNSELKVALIPAYTELAEFLASMKDKVLTDLQQSVKKELHSRIRLLHYHERVKAIAYKLGIESQSNESTRMTKNYTPPPTPVFGRTVGASDGLEEHQESCEPPATPPPSQTEELQQPEVKKVAQFFNKLVGKNKQQNPESLQREYDKAQAHLRSVLEQHKEFANQVIEKTHMVLMSFNNDLPRKFEAINIAYREFSTAMLCLSS